MSDTQLSLKLQLFKTRLFETFKGGKAELKAKSKDDSEPDLTYVNNQPATFTILQLSKFALTL